MKPHNIETRAKVGAEFIDQSQGAMTETDEWMSEEDALNLASRMKESGKYSKVWCRVSQKLNGRWAKSVRYPQTSQFTMKTPKTDAFINASHYPHPTLSDYDVMVAHARSMEASLRAIVEMPDYDQDNEHRLRHIARACCGADIRTAIDAAIRSK